MDEAITISRKEYEELKAKAAIADKIAANNAKAGKKSAANLTPEQRSERARKAVAARMAKYGQESRKGN